jgi:hypothetical protein
MEEWPEKKPLLKEKNKRTRLVFAKRHVGDFPNKWKKVLWLDETKIEIFLPSRKTLCIVQTQHLSSPRESHPHSEAWWWQHHAVGMFFISRD